MRKWIIGAVFLALLAGCSSNPQQSAPVEDRTPAAATPSTNGTGASTGGATAPGVGGTAGSTAGTGANPLRDRSVYFDFDAFAVKDEFRNIIEAHARYLQSHPEARITIQGNTDERGSREYNIALGQKRADAVRQVMRVLGAGENQIETVSFGKEKPRNPGHDEAAWAENRRADIVYAGE
jgi:peptidoglycan-associated lipoprotein